MSDDPAAIARSHRLRQVRARALAKNEKGGKAISCPEPSTAEAAAAAAAELAQQQAQADEAMRALLAEEDSTAQNSKSKGGKRSKRGNNANSSAQPSKLSTKRQVKISKAMSYLLRHGAAEAGLQIRPDGYVVLTSLLEHTSLSGCTVGDAVAVVSSNDKQRFSLYTDSATGILWIRANQGHTLRAVQDSELLTKITDPKDAPVCIHGTYYKVLPLILQSGLSRMKRNHIHFAPGFASEKGGVISGMRGDCEVAIYLDVPAALRSGIKLYRSENGVLLSPGDASGSIPPAMFAKVVDIQTDENLLPPAQRAARDRSSADDRCRNPDQSRLPAGEPTAEGKLNPACLIETVGNLFTHSYGAGDGICHCVSEDMHMGAGIATEFKKRYGRVADLLAQNTKTGGCAQIQADDHCWIYYLVTKVKYNRKPTYDSLRRSLTAMKLHMLSHGVKRLSLPKIGCGLDKLEWVVAGVQPDVRSILLDVFEGTDVTLTVYELGSIRDPPSRRGRQVSERDSQMQIYDAHRARLQSQGLAAEAHRSLQQSRKGQGRTAAGRASRRAEQKMRRQESQYELLPSPEPVAAFWDERDVESQAPSDATKSLKQCKQCEAFATNGRLDTTVDQWFCDACWESYEAEDVGASEANSAKTGQVVSTKEDERANRLSAKRAAALRKLGTQYTQLPNASRRAKNAPETAALLHAEQMTAALLREKWMSMTAGSVEVLPFYTEHGQHGIFSNFCPSRFDFDLPISLLFEGSEFNRLHGFRTPVTVQWSEQAIMLCKAALFGDVRSYAAIIAAASPMEAKRLGRAVKHFDEYRWGGLVCDVAREVVSQKFTKVDGFAAKLRATGTKVLAEASEIDAIWGIGMRCDDPCCRTPSNWRGANILGWALMEARDLLGAPNANEVARQAAMAREDERLQSNSRSQVHVDKAPPKHSLAAMASMGSRRERQQDNVMTQMQNKAAEAETVGTSPEASYQEIHTCHLYGVDEIMSAFQKTMRRNQVDDAMWWAMELEMSGLGRMAMSRLTVITVEDIGTGAPLLPVYISAAWRAYMDLQDPQSSKYNAQGAKAKLMEAAYTVSVVRGNHMTCSAKHAGTLALKAELMVVGDSAEAATEAAGDGSKGLADRASGLVASAKAAIEMAREATLPEECTAMELKALGRLQALASRAPTTYTALTWTMLRKFQTTYKCTLQSVESLYAMCHGGGCSTADLCVYNALLLITREPWMSFPPSALEGIKVSDPMKVTPEICGCASEDLSAAPVDFASVAKMLSELPCGIGGRHPDGLPWYVVDGHTRRGSGMDTTGLFHEAAQRWKLSSEIAEWPDDEIAVSHGPGRERGPVDENGHGGSWLRSPDGVSFPSNVERSFGHDDGSEDDPFASTGLILESMWGVSGADMSDDEMSELLASLGKARVLTSVAPFLQADSQDAFPSLEDAASGAATSVQKPRFGTGNMWDDSVGTSGLDTQGDGPVRRKGQGAKKRRSRVQGSGWADRQ